MALGLVGRKVGMTRVFQEDGISVPVTVIEVLPNTITQIKNQATDGYSALQVTTGEQKSHRVNKPDSGQYAKASVQPGTGFWEFRISEEQTSDYQMGAELTLYIDRCQ